MKYDVISFGGAVVDAFLDSGISEKKGNICLPVGHKLLVKELWFATGGGGTNAAVSFSNLGLKTGFIGRLGRDENAETILEELEREKVKWLGKQGKEPTGFSVVIDSKQKNRSILVCKEANEHIKFSDFNLKEINTKWLYFSSMVGETLKTQIRLAHWASKRGISVAYNPSHYLTKRGASYLKHLLKHVRILILNDEEAENLAGFKDRNEIFKKLHSLGPKIVCITMGQKGNESSDGNYLYRAFPRGVRIREKTGAGDAFASGFIAGLIKLKSVEKAVQVGSMNAESVIQKAGAKNGLMSWSEVRVGLKKNVVRVKKGLV